MTKAQTTLKEPLSIAEIDHKKINLKSKLRYYNIKIQILFILPVVLFYFSDIYAKDVILHTALTLFMTIGAFFTISVLSVNKREFLDIDGLNYLMPFAREARQLNMISEEGIVYSYLQKVKALERPLTINEYRMLSEFYEKCKVERQLKNLMFNGWR